MLWQNLVSEEAKSSFGIFNGENKLFTKSAKNSPVSEKITLFFSISRGGGQDPLLNFPYFFCLNPSLKYGIVNFFYQN